MRTRFAALAQVIIPVLLLSFSPRFVFAQTAPKPSADQSQSQSTDASTQQGSQDGAVVPGPDQPNGNTPEDNKQWAWKILTAANDDHKHSDVRIQGLAALGLLGDYSRSMKMILDSFNDPDVDIRTAAVLAAGETKAASATTDLRKMLDDAEPQVAFAAATTLWKMNDRSGEDILIAVVDGERRANATLRNGTMHTVNRDLHHPSDLARIGALEGATMLLGPFGFGITAVEYMRKNGGDSARVAAVEQVAQNHTAPIREKLIAALKDKDVAVRAAAAKALAGYHEPDVAPALAEDFPDPKTPVRLTAAAAYLMSTGAVATPAALTTKQAAPAAKKSSHKTK